MIRHIVLLKARTEVTEAHIEGIFADLHALSVPGILAIHSGRSESPEKIERGYLHGFTIDFADSGVSFVTTGTGTVIEEWPAGMK